MITRRNILEYFVLLAIQGSGDKISETSLSIRKYFNESEVVFSSDADVRFLGDIFEEMSKRCGREFLISSKSGLDSEPVLISCERINIIDLMDAIWTLFSFKQNGCFWEMYKKNQITAIEFSRTQRSKLYAEKIPGDICIKVEKWIEEVCASIEESENKRNQISESNPMMDQIDSEYKRSQYVAFSRNTSPKQRHDLLFGNLTKVEIPISSLDEKSKQFVLLQQQKNAVFGSADTLSFHAGSWDQYSMSPVLWVGLNNKNMSSGPSFACGSKTDKILLNEIKNNWINKDDKIDFKIKNLISKKFIPNKKYSDETAEAFRKFSSLTGIPIVARLPNVPGKIQINSITDNLENFLSNLDRVGFMYKWRNGILLICLKSWYFYDNEEYKVSYTGIKYLQKIKLNNAHLNIGNIFELIKRFTKKEVYRLGFKSIYEIYDVLKEIASDEEIYQMIFSVKGIAFKSLDIRLQKKIILSIPDLSVENRKIQLLRIREITESKLGQTSFDEKKLIFEVLFQGEKSFVWLSEHAFDGWKKG